jgi:hypothetical protein
MKKILCGAVVVGVTFLASAARADEQPTKTTTQPEKIAQPAPKPVAQPDTTTPTTTTTTRRGLRYRRDNGTVYRERGGRLSAFLGNLRGRFSR